jgi:putative aminopeptidase FrvX
MESLALLRELSDAFGVSGFEDDVRERIERLIRPFVDDVTVDSLGNLIATRSGSDDRVLMLDAHMDEIGFLVKWIDKEGFLRFTPIGGWDERIILGHRVEIRTREGRTRHGVIGSSPPHILKAEERKAPVPLEKMFVDVGATSRQEAADMGIRIGDPLTIHYPFLELTDGYVTGKAFDDRAGCSVLLETAQRLAEIDLPMKTTFAFVFGEEVGLRGARTAAFQIEPDLAIALEGTIGADTPDVPDENQPTRLGRGPAISVADRSIIVSPKVIAALEAAAEAESIPYQYKLPAYGGSDAGAIHLTRGGVLAGIVSVPCRFIHSPISTLRLNDYENTVRLMTRFVRSLPDAVF